MPVPRGHHVMTRSLLRDEAYRAIRDAIVDGTLAPGERLLDTELVEWLGVSRTPIREALARLEQAGLVRSKPGRYTIVAPLDVRATREAQSVAAALHALAVREAAATLTDVELTSMREANQRLAEALRTGDVDGALTADDEFHAVPVVAAANETLRTMLDQVTPLLRRVERVRFATLAGRSSVAQHAEIVELCASGDVDGAAAATRRNWETLGRLLTAEARGEDAGSTT
ncbi:DNA-binding GntR family transcriptional regulator [Actinoalloteichus hoggarensis]|uniref:Putative HTH-type transcriptional regulator YdfH n=1 Tax=Actinoalloteichus hoggarensis TaxID=1470176 RepID=A0A221W6C1_9PSEU|nr:GntR family transcriptional regulator [Actinoalloteichus hoggarensis]ASO21284.1 putative HTH-type transcriptional regulator YdfH [Actinoalloteichus hoggarensis]MBB5921216.1 DNA-binding GntR family transcriptional regulator [Actinoalloteichus hoggarensis]